MYLYFNSIVFSFSDTFLIMII